MKTWERTSGITRASSPLLRHIFRKYYDINLADINLCDAQERYSEKRARGSLETPIYRYNDGGPISGSQREYAAYEPAPAAYHL